MSLQTQFMTFFISPFSEPSASAELKNFLKSHRIINVEKRLIDGDRGTGWVFLVEYTDIEGGKSAYTMSSKVDWHDVFNPSQFFANFYLSSMDHMVLEILKPHGYVRYMDDVIIFDESKKRLLEIYKALSDFVVNELFLTFKQPVINKCANGIPFLGFLIRRNSISILSKNWKRKLKRAKQMAKDYSQENESDMYNRYSSMFTCLAMREKNMG